MATVYLAHDVRHDRQVALKLLSPELGAVLGAERFLAEIRVTANLQHPNVLPLFDSGEADGLLFYVMPFVEGETLRTRLAREKQLPIDDAVRIAVAVAGALDYAHRHGVIHRDLKPDNILLHEGQPLIADFGIALAVSNAGGSRITQTGLSLGTPQYMSPEQATGDRTIDGRADIYSLGAVLYEMLVGDPPYLGGTAQAIIAKVLMEPPPRVRSGRPAVPDHVEAAIDRSLEKLPADRFSTAREFADAVQGRTAAASLNSPVSVGERVHGSRAGGWRERVRDPATVSLAALLVIAAGLAAWGWLRKPLGRQADVSRFVVTLPRNTALDNVYAPLTITHDGRSVIFRGLVGSATQLVRRSIDQLDAKPIAGTTGGGWPTLSPDDKWIGFIIGNQVRKAPIEGGASVPLATVEGNGSGLAWAPGDMLVIGGAPAVPALRVVPASGGVPRVLTTLNAGAREVQQAWPYALADGNTIVYTSWPAEGLPGAHLAVASLKTGETHTLDIAGTFPFGVAEGQLLYVRGDGVLMAVPFDARTLRTRGSPVALLEGINLNATVGAARVALAETGTLVYLTAGSANQLVAVDMSGTAQPLLPQTASFAFPSWSPDGRHIAVAIASGQGQSDIWLFDVTSSALTRLTFEGNNTAPSWTADGQRVVFRSDRGNKAAVWVQSADGSAMADKLFESPAGLSEAVLSPDGHTLVYMVRTSTSVGSLWYADLAGDKVGKPLLSSRFAAVSPAFSPDGKWLAYVTDETAQQQVYVRSFPGPGAVTQVSVDGGIEPVWAPDGSQIFFRHGRQVVAASVTRGQTLSVGARRTLFEGSYYSAGALAYQSISIAPDGKRFVMLRQTDDDAQIVVVTNWLSELRARTGAGR